MRARAGLAVVQRDAAPSWRRNSRTLGCRIELQRSSKRRRGALAIAQAEVRYAGARGDGGVRGGERGGAPERLQSALAVFRFDAVAAEEEPVLVFARVDLDRVLEQRHGARQPPVALVVDGAPDEVALRFRQLRSTSPRCCAGWAASPETMTRVRTQRITAILTRR